MKRFIFILVLVCLLPTTGYTTTGNELKELAFATKFTERVFFGYIEAVVEINVQKLCIPIGVSRQQCVDVVLIYLRDNPAILHQPAADLILHAVKLAWPCK